MVQTVLRVEMFGGFQVVGAGMNISRFRTRQTTSLFAYLALNRGKRLPREVLAEMFWPDAPNLEKARASLAVAVSSLRSQLETEQVGQILLVDPRSLGVRAEGVSSDVFEFEQALDRLSSDNTPATVDALRQTLSLFRGTFLPGFYDNWVLSEQARIRDRFTTAVRRLGSYFEDESDIDEAIYWRRQELLHFPEDTGALEHLIQLLIEEERVEEAAQAYHDALKRWKDDGLGVLPDSVRKRAQKALELYPNPTQKIKPRQPVSTASPRDETRTVILPPSLPSLPLEITRFVGRDSELKQIQTIVDQAESRLLTLIGPGGIGKTRLAIEVAHGFQKAGGTPYFIPLQNAHQEQEFLQMLASSLQVRLPASSEMDPLEPITYLLNQRSRPILILDNMEQLLETDAIACLGRLLQRVPQLFCLVTSQTRLSIPGERLYPISPLPVPSTEAILQGSKDPVAFEASWPSVALFVDRARESMPDFHLHARNLEAVGNVVRLLEGLPLAVLLAAARVQVMPPTEIWEGVAERFRLLSTNRRSGPERHRSLHASISWSYDLLRPELKEFFVKLTVFHGSFGHRDVEAVLETPLALDFLAELCDTSFLTTEISEHHVRFGMLESLRLFGNQQWDPTERERLREHHASHFALLADEARSHWRTGQEPLWMERLQNDLDNLRAAMTWSLESDAPANLLAAYQLGSGLSRFWWINIYHLEGKKYLSQILKKDNIYNSITPEQKIHLHIGMISQLMVSNDLIEARLWCIKGLEYIISIDNPSLEAIIYSNLGSIEMALSGWEVGIVYIKKSISILIKQKDYKRLMTMYHNTCLECINIGDFRQAMHYAYKEFLIASKKGTALDRGSSLHSIANCMIFSERREDSLSIYREAAKHFLESKNYFALSGSLSCYSLLKYEISHDKEWIELASLVHYFRKISGSQNGAISSLFANKYNINIEPIGNGSMDEVKETLISHTIRIVDGILELTSNDVRRIVRQFTQTL